MVYTLHAGSAGVKTRPAFRVILGVGPLGVPTAERNSILGTSAQGMDPIPNSQKRLGRSAGNEECKRATPRMSKRSQMLWDLVQSILTMGIRI